MPVSVNSKENRPQGRDTTDGDTESNALNGQQLRAHQTLAHGQSESELQCTAIQRLQTRITESYAKVRNMTKRLRTRERQLERLQEDAEKVRGEKTELAKFSILYQEKLASAESTIPQLLDKQSHLRSLRHRAEKATRYWKTKATAQRSSLKEKIAEAESTAANAQADAAALRKQLYHAEAPEKPSLCLANE